MFHQQSLKLHFLYNRSTRTPNQLLNDTTSLNLLHMMFHLLERLSRTQSQLCQLKIVITSQATLQRLQRRQHQLLNVSISHERLLKEHLQSHSQQFFRLLQVYLKNVDDPVRYLLYPNYYHLTTCPYP